MRAILSITTLAATLAVTGSTTVVAQQQELSFREMRWRDIGPTRAGRARTAVEPDGALEIGGTYQAQWRKVDGQWLIQAELFVPTRCKGGAYCRRRPS
jgi:hypothetical protein